MIDTPCPRPRRTFLVTGRVVVVSVLLGATMVLGQWGTCDDDPAPQPVEGVPGDRSGAIALLLAAATVLGQDRPCQRQAWSN